jgi:hypothetical protein
MIPHYLVGLCLAVVIAVAVAIIIGAFEVRCPVFVVPIFSASRPAEHSDLPYPSGSLTGGSPSSGVARRTGRPLMPAVDEAPARTAAGTISGWAAWYAAVLAIVNPEETDHD